MAVASEQNNTVSVQNSVEIVCVDEDDFPLANLMEHVQSDEDLDDNFELVQDEEEADTPNRTLPVPRGLRSENTEWSRNINLRPDLDFDGGSKTQVTFHRSLVAGHCFMFWKVTKTVNLANPRPKLGF